MGLEWETAALWRPTMAHSSTAETQRSPFTAWSEECTMAEDARTRACCLSYWPAGKEATSASRIWLLLSEESVQCFSYLFFLLLLILEVKQAWLCPTKTWVPFPFFSTAYFSGLSLHITSYWSLSWPPVLQELPPLVALLLVLLLYFIPRSPTILASPHTHLSVA